MDLRNQTLGNYLILEELGQGGMATVYLAQAPDGRYVAIKVLSPESAQRLDILQRFRREAMLYEKLRHPRIIHAEGLFHEQGLYFLVMDYMEGGSLAQRLHQQARLPWHEAVRVVRQIAEALAFAHSQGIVHRDVKPSNILFDAYGDAYLTDFGVAHDAQDVTLTQVGAQPGTYHYMSPEQIQGHPVTPQSDQFSLATVLFEALCGYRPFDAAEPYALFHQIIHEPPALLPEDLDAPGGVISVLQRAHAKDPKDRYPNIMAFARALEQLHTRPEPDSKIPIPPTKTTRRVFSPALLRWAGLGAGAAVLLLIVILAMRHWPFPAQAQPDTTPGYVVITPTLTLSSPSTTASTPIPTPSPKAPGVVIALENQKTPTPTPTPKPARTRRKPTPTLIPTATPRPSQPTKSKLPSSPSTPRPLRVTLIEPWSDQSLPETVTFRWRADFDLGPNQAFELAFWRPGQDPMRDARSPVGAGPTTEQTVHLSAVPFIHESSDWYWGVFLFDTAAQRRVRLLSQPRAFSYHSPQSSSGAPTPTPSIED